MKCFHTLGALEISVILTAYRYRLFEQIKKNANKGNLNMKYADDNAAEEDDEYA